MDKTIQHLIDWSEWGQQWIGYLRKKPQQYSFAKRDLNRFAEAFSEVGRKAAALQHKPPQEPEITILTAKAEEIQMHFHEFLKLIKQKEREQKDGENSASRIYISRPVPVGGHKLPSLPYSYNALEPYIDAETMRIHHDQHHRSYVEGLNKAETMLARARANNDFELITHWEREAAFHGAGHYLHTIFWNVMSPSGGGNPQGELAEQIIRDYGSIEAFKQHFSQAAEKVRGNGWAILVWSLRAQHLEILQAEHHQNATQWDVIPLLVLDVWEHAYYLTYRNKRAEYIEAWWNVVNWAHVQDRYLQARRLRWQPY